MNNEEMTKLVKNINFLNNQNYIVTKELLKSTESCMWIIENWKNMIWFDKNLKIQEIKISKIKWKTNKLKIVFAIFFGIFLWVPLFVWFNEWFWEVYPMLIWTVFFMCIFIPPWFMTFGSSIYNFYRNRDKIIIFNKNLTK